MHGDTATPVGASDGCRALSSHGGLAQYGYPLSAEFNEKSDLNGKTYQVQYFERAVFEYHPELNGANSVQLTQLGRMHYQ